MRNDEVPNDEIVQNDITPSTKLVVLSIFPRVRDLHGPCPVPRQVTNLGPDRKNKEFR